MPGHHTKPGQPSPGSVVPRSRAPGEQLLCGADTWPSGRPGPEALAQAGPSEAGELAEQCREEGQESCGHWEQQALGP